METSKADNEDENLEQLDILINCIESKLSILTEFDEELFRMIVERIVAQGANLEFTLISNI